MKRQRRLGLPGLNAEGGFTRCVELFGDDDERATADANPSADGRPMELWRRDRWSPA